MTHYIKLSDNDVISMDEQNGNIVVAREKLPPRINEGEVVMIRFIEDEEEISHKYTIDGDYDHKDQVELTWVEQLGESILTEAPRSAKLAKAMNKTDKANIKDQKRADRKHKKILDRAEKLLVRDLKPEGRTWKFYFQKENGKYEKAVSQEEARRRYQEMGDGELTPDIANAIVTTEQGTIIRRGMEDLDMKGVRLTKKTAKLNPEYSLSWSDTEFFDPSEEEEVVSTTTEETPDTATPSSQLDVSATEPTETSESSEEATPATDGLTTINKGVTKPIINKFRKIAMATGLEVNDAFDKPVDMNSAIAVGKITPETLADYTVKIKGKEYQLADWLVHAMKNKVITESCDPDKIVLEDLLFEAPVVRFDDAELNNPDKIDIRDNIRRATEKEKQAAEVAATKQKEQKLQVSAEQTLRKFHKSLVKNFSTEDTLEVLFDDLVPPSGAAESVAGELTRAMMRLLYRDANDGDKFFTGYGIETCSSSAMYLYDHGFAEEIQSILDSSYKLAEDDAAYTDALMLLAESVIKHIKSNTELMWTVNEDDSREWPADYIEEEQPRYEFEIQGTAEIEQLVENGILDAWKLNEYAEQQLSNFSACRDAEVSIPWSHNSTNVTIENLTKDGLDAIEDSYSRDPEGWWADLVSEYEDQLHDSEYDDEYDAD